MKKTDLFGVPFEKPSLLERMGGIGQICDARKMTYAEGRMAGVQSIEVTNGSGLAFSVLPSRGLDIAHASFRGVPFSWISSTGVVSPSFYEPKGNEWLRNFAGGLLTTCGLTHAGLASEDKDEQLGLHGRIANTPATDINLDKKWKDNDYSVSISGKIVESKVFGDNLILHRSISTSLGSNKIIINDTVENAGFKISPLMVLYHVNIGWPVMSEDAELITKSGRITPSDENAAAEMDEWSIFLPPQKDYIERCYLHDLTPGDDGFVRVALVNKRLGIGIYEQFKKAQFPYFVEWKMNGQGEYVVGLEPGNVAGARAEMRRDGTLEHLDPGAERNFCLEIGVLDGAAEIEEFVKKIG